MASRLIVPFDNFPVSTQKGTGTYTCPAGKYALVTVTVSGEARSTFGGAGGGSGTASACSGGEFNESFNIWVRPGDTVSATLSNASGATSINSSQSGGGSGTTTATVNHNASAIAIFRAQTSMSLYNGTGGTLSITRTGTSSFHFYAQEYNIVS